MTVHPLEAYQQLSAFSRQTRVLEGVSQLIGWDQETYMPEHAEAIRAEQAQEMSGILHERRVSPHFKKLLSSLIDLKTGDIIAKGLNDKQIRSLKEWRRDYLIESLLPEEFVKRFAKLVSESQMIWRKAKKNNQFKIFAPALEEIVKACREKADYIGYQDHPYDALLDLYEPGMTTKKLTKLFSELKEKLLPIYQKIMKSKQQDDSFLFGKFAASKQTAFAKTLLDHLGYDWKKGRLDLSAHPFSMSTHPTDSRITWRIHPTNLINNLSTVLHEAGHSLYETGLSQEHYGEPQGEARSLGFHESQSRFWEVFIGQSKPFWKYFHPLLMKTFPKAALCNANLDEFVNALNKVSPSLIRVEADEMTYPMHVILRFELEKRLIEGSLTVKDLPKAWNKLMKELLGIEPKDDATGCLQDIHWAWGTFGYFPTYLLGSLYAAHLLKGFKKAHPHWEKEVEKGKLGFISKWLQENVWDHGRLYSSEELLKNATGEAFTPQSFIDYLKHKYTA